MISRRLLLASAAAFLFAGAADAASPTPIAIVKSIYAKRDPYGAAAALQMRATDRTAVLSKSFAALWKRSDDETPAEDEPVPGFDVASNSQGLEVARAEVKLERADAARSTVVAKLIAVEPFHRNSPAENVLRYDFVREGGRWMIDDIRGTSGKKEWSLRGELTASLKN